MKRINIAIIGMNLNSHSTQIITRLRAMTDRFHVVGYVLPENEKERLAHKMQHLDGLPELTLEQVLNDPSIEAVAVETDEIYLSKYALMAAKAGKHIHMEKPGGRELADFEALIDTVKKNNLVFSTGYMYRHNPYVMELMEQIRSGELGDIICVEAQMNCSHSDTNRQWLQDLPGGMMFYLGCHLIDLIYLIQGEPDNIIPMNRCIGKKDITAKDFGFVVFEYPHGVSFAKTIAAELGGFQRRQLVVTGTKGTVEINPLEVGKENDMRTYRVIRNEIPWHAPYERTATLPFDRYNTMLDSFAAYVRGEKENPYTPDYELKLYKLLLRCCGE